MKKRRNWLFLTIAAIIVITTLGVSANEVEGRPNNIFGLHLNQPEEDDIKSVCAIANSSGGVWGYATFTIQRNDKNVDKWNNVMNQLRRCHIIPIIRIATEACGDSWCEPREQDIKEWTDFLDKLRWPVKRRYVVVYNEVNRAGEWGGKIDPVGYARVFKEQAKALKDKNADFIPVIAGFDSAAPNHFPYMDQAVFWRQMVSAEPAMFDQSDCITSHSYPNHGFVGSPNASGRNSILNFQWELNLLKSLGVNKDLCVLITETGWPHAEGSSYRRGFYGVETLKTYYPIYYSRVGADSRVVATTAFISKDCGQFEHFSWFDCVAQKPWGFVDAVKAIPKTRGEPEQRHLFNIKADLPKLLTTNSKYTFKLVLANGGQAWLDESDGYAIKSTDAQNAVVFGPIVDMQPAVVKTQTMTINTNFTPGDQCFSAGMYQSEKTIVGQLFNVCFELIPPRNLEFQLGGLIQTRGEVKVQFIDSEGTVVYEEQVNVQDKGVVPEIRNVYEGETYRVVVSKDYHVSQEVDLTIKPQNKLQFNTLVPIDSNNDGEFSLDDLLFIRDNLMKKEPGASLLKQFFQFFKPRGHIFSKITSRGYRIGQNISF